MTTWDVIRQVYYIAVFVTFLVAMLALVAHGACVFWFEKDSWQMLICLGAAGGCGAVTDSTMRQANKHLEEVNRREKQP